MKSCNMQGILAEHGDHTSRVFIPTEAALQPVHDTRSLGSWRRQRVAGLETSHGWEYETGGDCAVQPIFHTCFMDPFTGMTRTRTQVPTRVMATRMEHRRWARKVYFEFDVKRPGPVGYIE
jgi:hypothetical protein